MYGETTKEEFMTGFKVTHQIKQVVNRYLGYELLKSNMEGRTIWGSGNTIQIDYNFDKARYGQITLSHSGNVGFSRLCRIIPENIPDGHIFVPMEKVDLQCVNEPKVALANIPSKKARILMAALFPDEIYDEEFKKEYAAEIEVLRSKLISKGKKISQQGVVL